MAIERNLLKRFSKALTAWFIEDTVLVTLTGHTSGAPRIYVLRGNDPLSRPSLVLEVLDTQQYLHDVDGVYTTEVQAICYADSRIEALEIAGEVLYLCRQNTTTLVDAKFASDSIRTKSIRALGITSAVESLLDPTSIRRTERSDVVAPDRYAAVVPVFITWLDTSA